MGLLPKNVTKEQRDKLLTMRVSPGQKQQSRFPFDLIEVGGSQRKERRRNERGKKSDAAD